MTSRKELHVIDGPTVGPGQHLEIGVVIAWAPDGSFLEADITELRVAADDPPAPAKSIRSAVHHHVLHVLRGIEPATDWQIIRSWRYSNPDAPEASTASIRSRRAELVRAGLIEQAGLTTSVPGRRSSRTWKVTEAGRSSLTPYKPMEGEPNR